MKTNRSTTPQLFPKKIIDSWIKDSNTITYKKGTTISGEITSDDTVYLLIHGQASILRTHLDGKECVVGLVKHNDFLNIHDIFSTINSNMSFKAITDIEVSAINKTIIKDFVLNSPEQSLSLLNFFSDSLQEMSEMLAHIAYGKVEERIMFLFEKISEVSVDQSEWLVISKQITHQDIASMIGSTRETVSVVIQKLISRGYMKHDKENSTILVNKKYINSAHM